MSENQLAAGLASRIANMQNTAKWYLEISEDKDGVQAAVVELYVDDHQCSQQRRYGVISGLALRTIKPVIYYMLSGMNDSMGVPSGFQAIFDGRITYRGNLPLDNVVGHKLALLSILLTTVKLAAKIEIMGWRVERMPLEEIMYWLNKVTEPSYGDRTAKWAIIGLRVVLAGPTDQKEDYSKILEKLRR